MEIFIREIVGKWFLDFLIIRLVIFVFNGIEVGMKGNERRRKKDWRVRRKISEGEEFVK